MTRFAAALLGIGLVLAAPLAGWPADAPDGGAFKTTAADRDRLEQVLREGGVVTEAPRPSVTEYVGDVVTGGLQRLLGWLFGSGGLDDSAARAVRWMVLLLAVLLATMLAVRWLHWWQRRRARRDPPDKEPVLALEPDPADRDVDWRHELETRLARGDAAGALEALWWWLARRLGLEPVDASWTTRELAHRAGRRDLMPLMRRWDRLLYGGGPVDVDGVRGLWRQLQQSLERSAA